jgi:expansin (peptidoglycan-binding protein)
VARQSDLPVGWRIDLNKYRETLWEVHPITKIEVFKGGKWVNLDSLQ